MKLNNDCVRDLLLYIEENSTINKPLNMVNVSIKEYSNDEICYTSLKLVEASFINGKTFQADNNIFYAFMVQDLTWEGHQFLDNIRDPKVWTETKSKLSKFMSTSLSVAADVASQVIAAMINNSI